MWQMTGEANQSSDCSREHINIKLDDNTLTEVRELAQEAGCSTFEMCVILVKERIKWTSKRGFLPGDHRKIPTSISKSAATAGAGKKLN
jgi:hypothetical protein